MKKKTHLIVTFFLSVLFSELLASNEFVKSPSVDTNNQGVTCFQEGKHAFDQANYSRSLQLYLRFIKLAEQSDGSFPDEILDALCNIGAIHFYYSDYLGAVEYFRQGYERSLALGNTRMQEIFINNQCICLIKLNRLNEAEQMVRKLSKVRRVNKGIVSIHYYYLKGNIEMSKGEWDKAIYYLKAALKAHDIYNLDGQISETYKDIGACYEARNEWDSALFYTRKAEEQAVLANNIWELSRCMRSLMNIYAHLNDMENMLKYQERYFLLSDSLMNRREYMMIRSTHEQFEKNERGRQIQDLSFTISRQKTYLIGGCLLTLFTISFLLYQYRQKRRLFRAYEAVFARNRELIEAEKSYRMAIAHKKEVYPSSKSVDECNNGCRENEEDDLLQKITDVMENTMEYCKPDFGLPQLTALVGSNVSYVSSVIRNRTGKNVRTFINEYRIREARRRIMDAENYGQYTLQAIAESVGYDTPSTFNRAFKNLTGITPSLYQKLARQDNLSKCAGST